MNVAMDAEEFISLGGLHILLVDDDADTLNLFSFVLSTYGAEVKTAASAREALKIAETEPFDILISDMMMPHETGADLVKQLRMHPLEKLRKIPAIAITGYATTLSSKDLDQQLKSIGFHSFLPKPVDPEHLVEVVTGLADSNAQA